MDQAQTSHRAHGSLLPWTLLAFLQKSAGNCQQAWKSRWCQDPSCALPSTSADCWAPLQSLVCSAHAILASFPSWICRSHGVGQHALPRTRTSRLRKGASSSWTVWSRCALQGWSSLPQAAAPAPDQTTGRTRQTWWLGARVGQTFWLPKALVTTRSCCQAALQLTGSTWHWKNTNNTTCCLPIGNDQSAIWMHRVARVEKNIVDQLPKSNINN